MIVRSAMFTFILVALLAGTAACGQGKAGAGSTLPAGNSQRSLTVDGLERSYLLHIPAGLPSGKPVPLLLVFHGLQENAAWIQQTSGFNEVADKNGFIVIYPNGSGPSGSLSWNAGDCCGSAQSNNISESDFVKQILADVGTLASIDPKRTYASGFSNGALLSYRLACEMSDTFAAVAPVAGVLLYSPCQPSQPVSILAFHGATDNVVPPGGGGTVPTTGKPFPPVMDSLTAWAGLDGCSGSPTTGQSGLLTHTSFTGCRNGTAVELYMVQGNGHSWPSQYVVPASQMIWDFFKAHPKQ